MVQKTDPRNVYNITLPPLANETMRFTFQPTFLGPVVRFRHSTLLDADSEYTSDHIDDHWFPCLQPSSG
jgi:hypothetical protein